MRPIQFFAASLLVALAAEAGLGQPGQERLVQTRQEALPFSVRLSHATEGLSGAPNSEEAIALLRGILFLSPRCPRVELVKAVSAVEAYRSRLQDSSPEAQEAFYVLAQLRYDSGDKEAAIALFHRGVENGWTPRGKRGGLGAMLHCLRESDPVRYAAEFYNAVHRDPTGAVYAKREDYLSILAVDKLWPIARTNPNFSAADALLPLLTEATPHQPLAEAICKIIDQDYVAAVSSLGRLKRRRMVDLAGATDNERLRLATQNELSNIPLYIAAAKVLAGTDLEGAEAAMFEFHANNRERPFHVFAKLMRVAYTLEGLAKRQFELNRGSYDDHKRSLVVTGFLIDEGFSTDARLIEAIGRNKARHLISMHMGGYLRQYLWDEAEPWCQVLADDYDPGNESCNNGLYRLGIVKVRQGRLRDAEKVFLRLSEQTGIPRWRRAAKAQLADLKMRLGEPPGRVAPLIREFAEHAAPDESALFNYRVIELRYQNYTSQY